MKAFNTYLLNEFRDQHGISIMEHSSAAPMLLILLRRFGCSFCRSTLQELMTSLPYVKSHGYEVGIVHMNKERQAKEQLTRYGLEDIPRFQDQERVLYRELGLGRAPLTSLFKPEVFSDGIRKARALGVTFPEVDPFQLPGAFVIDQGQVISGERVLSPNLNPDFLSLVVDRSPAAPELVLS